MRKLLVFLSVLLPLTTSAAFQPLVYGEVRADADCSAPMRAMLERAMVMARVSVESAAFLQCISDAIKKTDGAKYGAAAAIGPYVACKTDPYADNQTNTQILQVLRVMRSANPVANKCTGGTGGNAEAHLGQHAHGNPEFLTWSGWLSAVQGSLGMRICRNPGDTNCQFAAYPWPYSQMAGTMMHEIAHTHGYDHGKNEQAGAAAACGITNNPGWHYQVNTLPYIIGNCIEAHISRSAAKCGRTEGCGPGALRMMASMTGACSCELDPRGPQNIEPEPIGQTLYIQTFPKSGTGFGAIDIHIRDGQGTGKWPLDRDDVVHGMADVVGKVGNVREEIVVTGRKGLGTIGVDSFGITTFNSTYPNGTAIRLPNNGSPAVLNTANMKIVGIGDFDGNGKEDFAFRYPGGIVVIGLFEVGLGTIGHIRNGVRYGDWKVAESDVLLGKVRKAGTDAFVIRSAWGMALFEYHTSSKDAKIVNAVQFGTRLAGGWIVGDVDRVQGAGDFTGDNLDELFVRSPWGIGLLQIPQTDEGAWTTRWLAPFGTVLPGNAAVPGGWTLDSKDRYSLGRFAKGTGRTLMAQHPKAGLGWFNFNGSTFAPWMSAPGGLEIARNFAIRDTLISGGGYEGVWSLHDGKNGALVMPTPNGVRAFPFMTTPNTRVFGIGHLKEMKPGDLGAQILSTDM